MTLKTRIEKLEAITRPREDDPLDVYLIFPDHAAHNGKRLTLAELANRRQSTGETVITVNCATPGAYHVD